MATWKIRNYYKKSIEEHEQFSKDGLTITHRTGWRSGSWYVTTSDDELPEFEFDYVPGGDGRKDSIDVYNFPGPNIEDVELIETFDGCWEEYDWPEELDEDERAQLEELVDEEGVYALEEHGWTQEDTQCWMWGPIVIEDEDGNQVKIIMADEEGNCVEFKEEE